MIAVTLSHPDGQRRQILLAGVPRVGDHVILSNGMTPSLVVEHVLWMQAVGGELEPEVIVEVRPRTPAPRS